MIEEQEDEYGRWVWMGNKPDSELSLAERSAIIDRLNKVREQDVEFDARVKASLDRMQASSSSYPSKEEIRSVLHTLCVYAYDSLSSFRVVAEGVDGAGNGVLQFGIDAHPEDLEGSTFEQLVERLAAYSPNKDELSKDKQAAKAEFFGGGESIGGSGGCFVHVVDDNLSNEEWVEAIKSGDGSEDMPKLEPAEEMPNTLPPHIMSLVRECDDCRRKIAEAEKVVAELREGDMRGETFHPICTVEELYIDPNRELIRKNVKALVEHFGGES